MNEKKREPLLVDGRPQYEYRTTSAPYSIRRSEHEGEYMDAPDPEPPEGDNEWGLVSTCVVGDFLIWTWWGMKMTEDKP